MFLPFRLISTIFFIRFVDLEKDTVVLPQDMKNDKIFDDSQQAVQAAVIWSKPRHPIWEFILKRMVENVDRRYYGESPYSPTYFPYYFGALDYAREFPDEPSPRRDLEFWSWDWDRAPVNENACVDALPKELDSSICSEVESYYVLQTSPNTIAAFFHGGMHQQNRNPFLKCHVEKQVSY